MTLPTTSWSDITLPSTGSNAPLLYVENNLIYVALGLIYFGTGSSDWDDIELPSTSWSDI